MDITAWLDNKCERIANPRNGSSRSRDTVFRCAVDSLVFSDRHAALSTDEKVMALNALFWCAWSEGVNEKYLDGLYQRYKPLVTVPDKIEKD